MFLECENHRNSLSAYLLICAQLVSEAKVVERLSKSATVMNLILVMYISSTGNAFQTRSSFLNRMK